MNRLYCLTGATGHLGHAVAAQLLANGQRVRMLALPDDPHIPPGELEICHGDVRDTASLKPFFTAPPDTALTVIHCAGIVSIASRHDPRVYDVNVGGTQHVVGLCQAFQVDRLVYVGSVHAIPVAPDGVTMREPDSFDPSQVHGLYAQTKAEAAAVVLAAARRGLNASIVLPSGICGPGDYGRGHLTALVVDYCMRRLVVGLHGGYDFVDVRDVAAGIVACCQHGARGDSYILSNTYATVKELLTLLHEITGQRPVKHMLPDGLIKATAPLAERYYTLLKRPPLFTPYSLYTLKSNAAFSHDKATRELNYKPRDLKTTLTDTVNWLKAQGRI